MGHEQDYLRETDHSFSAQELALDQETLDTLWTLFEQIGVFWRNVEDSAPMKSRWLTFLANRIRSNPTYAYEYRRGAALMRRIVADLGEGAYPYLFTSSVAMISPPSTPLARLRQLVSNEFIELQLSLGGFASFGAKNYPGYFGGAHIPGQLVPYRTKQDRHVEEGK